MAKKTILNIDGVAPPYTWMDTVKPYGGYIKDVSINIGYNSASTASLSIVSEDGRYDMDESNQLSLRCTDGMPRTLDIPFLKLKMQMYPVSFSINNSSGGRILSVDLVERSIDYFNRSLVINKRFKPDGRIHPGGVIFIGEEYYENPNSSRAELIRRDDMFEKKFFGPPKGLNDTRQAAYVNPVAAEIARTEFGHWLWTPRDLEKKIGSICPISPNASLKLFLYDDMYFSESGSLQSILARLSNVFGGLFFWDSFEGWIDWMGPLDAKTAYNIAHAAAADKSALISERHDASIRETHITAQAQRAELGGGTPANPDYIELASTKVLTPIFGQIKDLEDEMHPMFREESLKGEDMKNLSKLEVDTLQMGRREFQALNLLKAFSLGDDFARVYILLKKAGAMYWKGTGGAEEDGQRFNCAAEDKFLDNCWQEQPEIVDDILVAGEQNAAAEDRLYIRDWQLVDELFPDPCPDRACFCEEGGAPQFNKEFNCPLVAIHGLLAPIVWPPPCKGDPCVAMEEETKCAPCDSCEGFGLIVNGPGMPLLKTWRGKATVDPKNPYWIAHLMMLYKNRNPLAEPVLTNNKAGKDALNAMKKDLQIAYVRHFKPRPGEDANEGGAGGKDVWQKGHGILEDGGWQSNPAYTQMQEWARMASKYFVARGDWTPACPKDPRVTVAFTYDHKNWLLPYPDIIKVVPPPDHAIAQYIKAQDVGVLSDLGEAFFADFLEPDIVDVTAADFVENISIGGGMEDSIADPPAGLTNRHSCLKAISAEDIKAEQEKDKENCERENTNELHIWERDALQFLTAEQKNEARKIAEHFYNFEAPPHIQDSIVVASSDQYSNIVLPKYVKADRADVKETFHFYPNYGTRKVPKYDYEAEMVEQEMLFTDVDGIDKFLNTIDIGVEFNGHIKPPNVAFLRRPDRYAENVGRYESYCNNGILAGGGYNFYNQSFNPEVHQSSSLEGMNLIPPAGAPAGAIEGRGEFGNNMGYEEDCNKKKESDMPIQGVTSATQSKIRLNLRQRAAGLFHDNADVLPNYSATLQAVGAVELPGIKLGLTNLSVNMGSDGPMVTYTIGNRKFQMTRNDLRQNLVRVGDDGMAELQEDSFMKKFSQKFINNLEQKAGGFAKMQKWKAEMKVKHPDMFKLGDQNQAAIDRL